MTVTGLFFLPLAPNTPSPTSALTSHISRKYLTSSDPLPPYHIVHHLLVDTSSFLPNHPISIHPRRYTQFLTLSHVPGKTYVGTSSTFTAPTATAAASASASAATVNGAPAIATAPMTIISVPTGPPAEELFWTTTRKMEPLWTFRSSLRIENGAAFSLLGGDWRLKLGDARTMGQGQGRVRGMVAELEFCGIDEAEFSTGATEEAENETYVTDWEGREKLLRSFWDGLVSGSGVIMDRLQVVVKVPGAAKGEKEDLTLVRQYMELLRFARP